MKKFKKLAYVFLILIIAVLSYTIYANASKDDEKIAKEKGVAQIRFIETKLINLLNEMNNIETKNYGILVSEISKQTEVSGQEETSKEESKSSSSSSEGSSSSGGSESSSTNSSSEGGKQESSKTNETTKEFSLKSVGVLTNSANINWNNVKSEIEILYSSLPDITLDLYSLNVNPNEVLEFNKEFDALTVVARDEKKEETLNELSKLYDYIPKFLQNIEGDELYKILTKSKSNIFKAYSKLDTKNWDEISVNIKQAIEEYQTLLTNPNIDTKKQYAISKGYVMINELQNAVEKQEEAVFLIKYKNILEEINNL